MSVEVEMHCEGRVVSVTLARPEAKNALDPATLLELAQAWDRIRDDPDIRAVVLTGKGDAFCAGMDLKRTIPAARRLASGERIDDTEFAGLKAAPMATLQTKRPMKPIVAAVNGHCRGQGTDMLLATDYRIASEIATFALEEASIGVFPRGNTTVLLARQVPWVHAMDLVLHVSGGWDATKALRAGLVNEVVPADQLLNRALEVAERLASYRPELVAAILESMRTSAFGEDAESAVWRSHKIGSDLMRE